MQMEAFFFSSRSFSRRVLEYALPHFRLFPATRKLDRALDLEDAGPILGSDPDDFVEKSLPSTPKLQTSRHFCRVWGTEEKVSLEFCYCEVNLILTNSLIDIFKKIILASL